MHRYRRNCKPAPRPERGRVYELRVGMVEMHTAETILVSEELFVIEWGVV